MLLARVKEHGEAVMLEAVDNVHASLFCRGLRGDGRKADIMFKFRFRGGWKWLGHRKSGEVGPRCSDAVRPRQ
jgi:hypothetical protein